MSWRSLDLTTKASAPLAIFAPSGYAYEAEGTKHVVFQGSNGDFESDAQLHEIWCETGDDWNHVNLTVDSGAPPASFFPSGYAYEEERTQHAIYSGDTLNTGDLGKIYEIYWGADDQKHWNDLTSAGGFGPSTNPPIGYDFGGNQIIVFRTNDGHVWVGERGLTGNWQHYDLNARYGVTAIANEPPTAFAQFDPVTNFTYIHILFYSANGQIHRFQGSGEAWIYQNVSQYAESAPPAADRPSGFSYNGGALYIVYRSNDGNINILRRGDPNISPNWEWGLLSGTQGAPTATPGTLPTAYVFAFDNTTHVDYADSAGDIHEIWSSDGLEWNWNPLTQNYGGPSAISSLAAYTFAKDNSQHIIYTGVDHHIWELQWTPGLREFGPLPNGGTIRPFDRRK